MSSGGGSRKKKGIASSSSASASAALSISDQPAAVSGTATLFQQLRGDNTTDVSTLVDVDAKHATLPPLVRTEVSKLQKRDSTTRLKALQQLSDLISSAENTADARGAGQSDSSSQSGGSELALSLLSCWPPLYSRLLLAHDWRVRVASNKLMGVIGTRTGKAILPYLKTLIGPWWVSSFDISSSEVAQSAKDAFASTIPAKNHIKSLIFCLDPLLNHISANLKHTEASLNDIVPLTDEESFDRYCFVVGSSIIAFQRLVETLKDQDSITQSKLAESIRTSLSFDSIQPLSGSKSSMIRLSLYSLISSLLLLKLPTPPFHDDGIKFAHLLSDLAKNKKSDLMTGEPQAMDLLCRVVATYPDVFRQDIPLSESLISAFTAVVRTSQPFSPQFYESLSSFIVQISTILPFPRSLSLNLDLLKASWTSIDSALFDSPGFTSLPDRPSRSAVKGVETSGPICKFWCHGLSTAIRLIQSNVESNSEGSLQHHLDDLRTGVIQRISKWLSSGPALPDALTIVGEWIVKDVDQLSPSFFLSLSDLISSLLWVHRSPPPRDTLDLSSLAQSMSSTSTSHLTADPEPLLLSEGLTSERCSRISNLLAPLERSNSPIVASFLTQVFCSALSRTLSSISPSILSFLRRLFIHVPGILGSRSPRSFLNEFIFPWITILHGAPIPGLSQQVDLNGLLFTRSLSPFLKSSHAALFQFAISVLLRCGELAGSFSNSFFIETYQRAQGILISPILEICPPLAPTPSPEGPHSGPPAVVPTASLSKDLSYVHHLQFLNLSLFYQALREQLLQRTPGFSELSSPQLDFLFTTVLIPLIIPIVGLSPDSRAVLSEDVFLLSRTVITPVPFLSAAALSLFAEQLSQRLLESFPEDLSNNPSATSAQAISLLQITISPLLIELSALILCSTPLRDSSLAPESRRSFSNLLFSVWRLCSSFRSVAPAKSSLVGPIESAARTCWMKAEMSGAFSVLFPDETSQHQFLDRCLRQILNSFNRMIIHDLTSDSISLCCGSSVLTTVELITSFFDELISSQLLPLFRISSNTVDLISFSFSLLAKSLSHPSSALPSPNTVSNDVLLLTFLLFFLRSETGTQYLGHPPANDTCLRNFVPTSFAIFLGMFRNRVASFPSHFLQLLLDLAIDVLYPLLRMPDSLPGIVQSALASVDLADNTVAQTHLQHPMDSVIASVISSAVFLSPLDPRSISSNFATTVIGRNPPSYIMFLSSLEPLLSEILVQNDPGCKQMLSKSPDPLVAVSLSSPLIQDLDLVEKKSLDEVAEKPQILGAVGSKRVNAARSLLSACTSSLSSPRYSSVFIDVCHPLLLSVQLLRQMPPSSLPWDSDRHNSLLYCREAARFGVEALKWISAMLSRSSSRSPIECAAVGHVLHNLYQGLALLCSHIIPLGLDGVFPPSNFSQATLWSSSSAATAATEDYVTSGVLSTVLGLFAALLKTHTSFSQQHRDISFTATSFVQQFSRPIISQYCNVFARLSDDSFARSSSAWLSPHLSGVLVEICRGLSLLEDIEFLSVIRSHPPRGSIDDFISSLVNLLYSTRGVQIQISSFHLLRLFLFAQRRSKLQSLSSPPPPSPQNSTQDTSTSPQSTPTGRSGGPITGNGTPQDKSSLTQVQAPLPAFLATAVHDSSRRSAALLSSSPTDPSCMGYLLVWMLLADYLRPSTAPASDQDNMMLLRDEVSLWLLQAPSSSSAILTLLSHFLPLGAGQISSVDDSLSSSSSNPKAKPSTRIQSSSTLSEFPNYSSVLQAASLVFDSGSGAQPTDRLLFTSLDIVDLLLLKPLLPIMTGLLPTPDWLRSLASYSLLINPFSNPIAAALRSQVLQEWDSAVSRSSSLVASWIFGSLIALLPSLVRSWWINDCDRATHEEIERFLSESGIGARLAQQECEKAIDLSKRQSLGEAFKLRQAGASKLEAGYHIEDVTIQLIVSLPEGFPLRSAEVKITQKSGMSDPTSKRSIQMMTTLFHRRDCSLFEVLRLWVKSLNKRFEGAEPCPICYSIVATDGSVASMPCGTCKAKFHKSCLLSWVYSSGNDSCPMCRSSIS